MSAKMKSVQLSFGNTDYELTGPEAGPLVVLLHGGSIPMWTWDRQVPVLVNAGFRVLRYDMFGKGTSACPVVEYDRNLFRSQLLDLLNSLGLTEPVHLVGFSFGGCHRSKLHGLLSGKSSNACFDFPSVLLRRREPHRSHCPPSAIGPSFPPLYFDEEGRGSSL